MSAWFEEAKHHPSAVLLAAQLLGSCCSLYGRIADRAGDALAFRPAAFYLYTTYGLLRYMFNDRRVTRDELFATGASFTVVAWAFAYLYVAVQVIWPGSFVAAVDSASPRTWVELLFLSFTTLTSTGLSDVVPVLPHARALVMIEQVGGLGYVAPVISRIVGLTLYHEPR